MCGGRVGWLVLLLPLRDLDLVLLLVEIHSVDYIVVDDVVDVDVDDVVLDQQLVKSK